MEGEKEVPNHSKAAPEREIEKRMSKKKMVLSGLICLAVFAAAATLINHFFNKKDPIGKINKEKPMLPNPPPFQVTSEVLVGDSEAGKYSLTQEKNETEPLDVLYDFSKEIKPTGFMLPQDLKPLHYKIRLIPFLNGNLSFSGQVDVEFLVLERTRIVTLHAEDLNILNPTAKIWKETTDVSSGIKILKQTYYSKTHFYRAFLNTHLEEGSVYTFSAKFEGTLNNNMLGFYYATYKDQDGIDRRVAATQFEPSFARRAFPCFDEPSMKANFSIVIARQSNMSTLSNMPRAKELPMEGFKGWSWDVFETSVSMSTYLVAFVVCDFDHLSLEDNFTVWTRKPLITHANYAAKLGPKLLSFFEGFFNLSYPLPKMDVAAIPDFTSVAMENWGLITYREEKLLVDQRSSGYDHVLDVSLLLSHEISHQWFGNLVSPAWWNDIWLNEGFATYMSYIGIDFVEPSWKVFNWFSDVMREGLEADGSVSSHPLRIPVNVTSEVLNIFNIITYKKGSSIIRMMNHFLTMSTMKKGLSNYLKRLAYKSATQDDLWHHLTLQAHEDGTLPSNVTVGDIMNTWTLQMGYPVLTVNSLDNKAFLSQKRFVLDPHSNLNSEEDYKWYIPISFTTGNNPNFTITKPSKWLEPSEEQLAIGELPSDQWVLFNIQQTGFYRVNYDNNSWHLLSKQLHTNHSIIDIRNRAQLIDDSFVLAKSGLINYDIPLTLVTYINKERGFIPWKNALHNLNFLVNMLEGQITSSLMQKFVSSIVIPLHEEFKIQPVSKEDRQPEVVALRNLIEEWACGPYLNFGNCTKESMAKFQKWKDDPSDFGILKTVLCRGIAGGNTADWEFMWEQYLASERKDFLFALACSQNETILESYLDKTLTSDKGIRKQDSTIVILYISRASTLGRKSAWRFLKNKWQHLLEYYGSSFFTMDLIIPEVTKFLKSKKEIKELKEFKAAYEAHPLAAKVVTERSLKNAEFNLIWMKKNVGQLYQWFFNHGYTE